MMRYRYFGRGTGLRVSEICLGSGVFGTCYGYGAEPAEAIRMIDAYVDAGGNFIDTADNYQCGESEDIIGKAIRFKRDKLVIATKYSYGFSSNPDLFEVGNNRKTMVRCVEASLKRLATDRIDIYWVHYCDEVTSTEEIMRGLEDLVHAGKILYIGVSNFPAWRVARAATIAQIRGAPPVTGLQIEYSLAARTPDRELLPMAESLGLGVVGWSPLGGGLLTGKYRNGGRGRASVIKSMVHPGDDPRNARILDAVIEIAQKLSTSPSRVALAWMSTRGVLPIIGPRTFEQLTDNLGASEVQLLQEHTAQLDAVSQVSLGFPHEMLGGGYGAGRFEKPPTPVA
jgi:aryl-alcohol dehydrogenase-like predicted oxidoreductase